MADLSRIEQPSPPVRSRPGKRLDLRNQIGWQVFRRIELRSGQVRYESHCAKCGKHFVAHGPRKDWRRRALTRRCKRHRARGGPVDNLCPPVALSSLPLWARPRTDPLALECSLGRLHHNCWFLPKASPIRIFEPQDIKQWLAGRQHCGPVFHEHAAGAPAWRGGGFLTVLGDPPAREVR